MEWLCFNIYSQLYDEVLYLYKLKQLIEVGELKIYTCYFERGYQDAYFIKLFIQAGNEAKKVNVLRIIDDYKKRNPEFKKYKFQQSGYVSESLRFGGPLTQSYIERIFVAASSIALELIIEFNDENYRLYSYFNLLLRSLILNYLTVRTFLNEESFTEFCDHYLKHASLTKEDSIHDSRFDMENIKSAMANVDIQNIFRLIDGNLLDLGTDFERYIRVCNDLKVQLQRLIHEEKLLYPIGIYEAGIYCNPTYNILMELCQSNNNKMGILSAENIYVAQLLKENLIKTGQ